MPNVIRNTSISREHNRFLLFLYRNPIFRVIGLTILVLILLLIYKNAKKTTNFAPVTFQKELPDSTPKISNQEDHSFDTWLENKTPPGEKGFSHLLPCIFNYQKKFITAISPTIFSSSNYRFEQLKELIAEKIYTVYDIAILFDGRVMIGDNTNIHYFSKAIRPLWLSGEKRATNKNDLLVQSYLAKDIDETKNTEFFCKGIMEYIASTYDNFISGRISQAIFLANLHKVIGKGNNEIQNTLTILEQDINNFYNLSNQLYFQLINHVLKQRELLRQQPPILPYQQINTEAKTKLINRIMTMIKMALKDEAFSADLVATFFKQPDTILIVTDNNNVSDIAFLSSRGLFDNGTHLVYVSLTSDTERDLPPSIFKRCNMIPFNEALIKHDNLSIFLEEIGHFFDYTTDAPYRHLPDFLAALEADTNLVKASFSSDSEKKASSLYIDAFSVIGAWNDKQKNNPDMYHGEIFARFFGFVERWDKEIAQNILPNLYNFFEQRVLPNFKNLDYGNHSTLSN